MSAEDEFEKWWNDNKDTWSGIGFYRADELAEAAFIAGRKSAFGESLKILDLADSSFPTYEQTFYYADDAIRQRMEGK